MKVEETCDEAGDELHHSLVLEVVSVVLAELDAVDRPEDDEDEDQDREEGSAEQPQPGQGDIVWPVEESPAREREKN